MAQRRMFSKTITSSSRFLMMPHSTQNLYFHLGMNADDDGFCEHFTVMRMTESKPDDLKILQAKDFVHVFDEQVLIILNWKENNSIRTDRYSQSKYLQLYKSEIMALSEGIKPRIVKMETNGIPDDNQWLPQVRLGKDSLGKVIKDKPEKAKVNYEDSFIIFYDLYNYPTNKQRAFAEWKKIDTELHQEIYNHVREYRSRGQGVDFPLAPNNYLKNKRWSEPIIENFKNKTVPQKLTVGENVEYFEKLGRELGYE